MPASPQVQAILDDLAQKRADGPTHAPRDPNPPQNRRPAVVKTYVETLEDRIAALEAQVAILIAKVG